LDRDLARRLYALVEEHDLANLMLQGALADLAQSHGDTVYAELIFLLTRLRLEPAEAARHWPGILRRQALISTATGHATDIRVAVLSYNLDVDRQLTRPKVVEMTWAEWTASTALLDEVTGLPNQRFLRAQLTREVERALRGPMPLSLIVLDADDFKRRSPSGSSRLAGATANASPAGSPQPRDSRMRRTVIRAAERTRCARRRFGDPLARGRRVAGEPTWPAGIAASESAGSRSLPPGS
jgi:hypothetical protein